MEEGATVLSSSRVSKRRPRERWEVRAGLKDNPREVAQVPDADLVRATRKGDSGAFEALVRRHLPAAHRLSMSIVRDTDEADDVCQDAFLSALKRIGQLRDEARFKSWFLSIVRNGSLNALSSEARRSGPTLDDLPELSDRGETGREIELKELEETLENALEELTVTQKDVFRLHDIQGMNHGEIATNLGISRGSSRVHLHMARRALRMRLDRSQLEGV